MSVYTLGFSAVSRCETFAPEYIFSRGNNLKVVRVNAAAVAAQMVKHHIFRYFPYGSFVGISVRHHDGAFFGENTVTVSVKWTSPVPTPTCYMCVVNEPFISCALKRALQLSEFSSFASLFVVSCAQPVRVVLPLTLGELTGTIVHVDSLPVVQAPVVSAMRGSLLCLGYHD